MNYLQNPIPLAEWVDSFTSWMTQTFSAFFRLIQETGSVIMDGMTQTMQFIPPLMFIAILGAVMFLSSRGKKGLTLFAVLGPLLILNQGVWNEMLYTLSLVIVATMISVILGIPLGIWMAKSEAARNIVTPILDFMQTMPAFVYLIPAVAFFGIGMVPGVFASVIFALPPTVRFTNLGIRQVPKDLTEASESFGSTGWQKLMKLELPLAKQTIFAGINQTTMLALSMVVTASMIGAPGLGEGVLTALQRANVGSGFVYGTALVILAILMDRLTQNINEPVLAEEPARGKVRQRLTMSVAIAAALFLIAGTSYYALVDDTEQTVVLSSVQWDSEMASAHVMKTVLEDAGFSVEIKNLDPTVMWSAVAAGEADATVAPWLPNTHGFLYDQYAEKMVELGPNMSGASNGIAVPSYMEVDSLADLTDEAGRQITGVEPGAGVQAMAQALPETYPNLSDWNVTSSSTGAMLVEMEQAIANEEEFFAVVWAPHWMFEVYDLKILEDPLLAMGEEEHIVTFARQGLEQEMPEVFRILDNFNWTVEDMQTVMLDLQEVGPELAARNWVDDNPDKVASWLK